MKSSGNLVRRILFCAVGMFFYATGVAFTKNCNMGISPIVSVAYVLSLILPISMGWCTTVANLGMMAAQRIMLKKDFSILMAGAQLLMSILFSLYIDFTAVIWQFVAPTGYIARLILFVAGCFVLAIGVVMVVAANFVVLPAEGTVNAMVSKFGLKFGNAKILFDAAMVVITILIGLICLHSVQGIREGTVIAIFLVGTFSKIVRPAVMKCAEKFSVV